MLDKRQLSTLRECQSMMVGRITKAFLHRYIGNISSPNLIGLVYYLTFEQVRIYFVLLSRNTGSGFGRCADNTQNLHHGCCFLATNQYPLTQKSRGVAARTILWRFQVLLVHLS